MALIAVSDGTEFSYNDEVFNSTIRTQFTEEPVESDDHRVVKYSRITIDVTGYLSDADCDDGETLDELVERLRRKLQVNCKPLIYKAKGIGDLRVNVAGSKVRDVAFGPKAGKFSFSSMGGAPDGCHAGLFSWSVSTCIPECESARYYPGKGVFSQVAYSVTYQVSEAGLVTITTRGTAQIPLTLQADNTLEANIDMYIADIIKPAPDGFRRETTRQISEDRANCNFTITDTQKELPPPNDCVHIEMRHRVSQKGVADNLWNATISGTLRMNPTVNKHLAWARFYSIAYSRILWAKQPTLDRDVTHVMCDFEEDLFTNTSTFNIRYRMNGTGLSLVNIIHASGLWRQVVNNPNVAAAERWTASSWSRSLRDDAHAPKGTLGATFNTNTDVIIDVCHPTVATTTGPAGKPRLVKPDDLINQASPPRDDDEFNPAAFISKNPGDTGTDSSWVNWVCDVERIVDHNQIRHKPLAGNVRYQKPRVDPFGAAVDVVRDISPATMGWQTDTSDIVQQTASPSLWIRLRGFGVRAGFRVNAPKLLTYGGKEATLKYERVGESTLAVGGGLVYFRTDWDLVYVVADPPRSVPLLANPMLKTDGQRHKSRDTSS